METSQLTAKNSKGEEMFIKLALVLALFFPGALVKAADKKVQSTGFVSVPEESETSGGAIRSKEALSYQDDTQANAVTLRQAWLEELDAIKAKEDAEVKAVQVREEKDRKTYEVQHDLTLKKKKINEYNNKQEEFAEEIDRMKSEISDLDSKAKEAQKDLSAAEVRVKMHEGKFSEAKADLDHTKANLMASIERSHKAREETSRKINNYMIEMQRLRAEAATSEAEIARADNDRARAESEELQLRGQWSATTVRAQALREDKNRILSELADMRARLNSAKKDFEEVRSAWQQAEKDKLAAQQKSAKEKAEINAEMRKLEIDTATTYTERANSEAGKIRLAAEIEKLQTDLTYVKRRNGEAHAEDSESQGTVMESRLAFETAKADLSKELAANETSELRNDAVAVKMRGLASDAEGSDMLDAHKPWMASKNCQITRTPASTGESAGKVHSGDRLIAAPSGGGYIKILNSSGRPAYVPMTCGHFSD